MLSPFNFVATNIKSTDINAGILSFLSSVVGVVVVVGVCLDALVRREEGDGVVRIVVMPARTCGAAAGASSDIQRALMRGRIHFGTVFSVLSISKPRFLAEKRGVDVTTGVLFVDVAFEGVFKLLFARGVFRPGSLAGVGTASRLRTASDFSKWSYSFL